MSEINIPEEAFSFGYHQITPNQMAIHQKNILSNLPTVKFNGLKVNEIYAYKHPQGYQIYVIENITPAGKQADFRKHGSSESVRYYSSAFPYTFIRLNDVATSFLGVTHEMIVAEAISRGLEIPPNVRRHHPQFFVKIPNRFNGEKTKIDRVKDALHPYMEFHAIGRKEVEGILETATKEIAKFIDHGLKIKVLNPGVESYYDRALRAFHDTIDFYSWLLPLVSPGGIFHITPIDTTH